MANLAINLLWLSVVLDAVDTFLIWLDIKSDPNRSIVVPLVGLIFMALIVSRVAAGRNWARFLCLLLVIAQLVTLFLVPGMAALTFGGAGIHGLLGAGVPLLEIVGTIMLFTPAGSAFFGR